MNPAADSGFSFICGAHSVNINEFLNHRVKGGRAHSSEAGHGAELARQQWQWRVNHRQGCPQLTLPLSLLAVEENCGSLWGMGGWGLGFGFGLHAQVDHFSREVGKSALMFLK